MLRVSLRIEREREGGKVKSVALLNHFHFAIKARTKTCWYFLTTFPSLFFLFFFLPLFSLSLFFFFQFHSPPPPNPPNSLSLPLSLINSYTDEGQLSIAVGTVRECSHGFHKAARENRTNHRHPLNFNQPICTALIL